MFYQIVIAGLIAFCLACGTPRQVINVSTISQPGIVGLGFASDCLSASDPPPRCKGDRVVVSGSELDLKLVRGVEAEIASDKYHRLVDEADPSLTVVVSVKGDSPSYNLQRSARHFPRQCVEREEKCWSSRELKSCLRKARQARNHETRERLVSGCKRRYRRCQTVCVSYREAYTKHRVEEACHRSISLEAIRYRQRNGEAVGKTNGLRLGSPTLVGSSTSGRVQAGYEPTAVGEEQLCLQATQNAMSKVGKELSPFEVHLQVVLADLSLPSFQTGVNQMRFGRFDAAHRAFDEAFGAAESQGVPSEDVAWIHHAKATVFHLQGQNEFCFYQLEQAVSLQSSLSIDRSGSGGDYVTPEGHFARLMKLCAK